MTEQYTVYMHLFPNNKKYIGITKQKLENRWKNGYGYRGQKLMFNAINKYGWENIKHIILKNNLSKQQAIEEESRYIQLYETYKYENGYNIAIKNNLPPIILNPVNQYDLNGVFIKTYYCIAEASRQTGINETDINQAIQLRRKTAGNFQWRQANQQKSMNNISPVKKETASKRRKIKAFLNDTYIDTYPNISAAARASNHDRSTVTSILKGINKITKDGYFWEYE